MARIFLSHSSADEREAIALTAWLSQNGWDDVFLDVDPERGLLAGERWLDALQRAADRCEVVLCLVSPTWAQSKWCLAEYLLARNLRKIVIPVLVKGVVVSDLPAEMTADRHMCRVDGDGASETIRITHRDAPVDVPFLADGLQRLKAGLAATGLGAEFFPWPPPNEPDRAPYRGLEPLDVTDAAVFFGRDTEIFRGMAALRRMRDASHDGLFVILGASGVGKSSFLRAGLLPRLTRCDREFAVLPVVRPQRYAISGEAGLAHALCRGLEDAGGEPCALGDMKTRLRTDPTTLLSVVAEIRRAAAAKLAPLDGIAPVAPTVVLPVDQAEELLRRDAGPEGASFLRLVGTLGRPGSESDAERSGAGLLLACTIRSDHYEPLKSAPELAGLPSVTFDELQPMRPDRFREVILGPARRASVEGRRVEVKADLVDRLLADCDAAGDALPLLGLTLARLYRDYGNDGDLQLDDHIALGGLASVVKAEVEAVLGAEAEAHEPNLRLLRAVFIPRLVTINPDTGAPMRRCTRRAELPPAGLPLVEALVSRRLLLADRRGDDAVIEVAHESLLRHWDRLAGWIDEERETLRARNDVEDSAEQWFANDRSPDHLDHRGQRLVEAEHLLARPEYAASLGPVGREYIAACRRREHEEDTQELQRLRHEARQAVDTANHYRRLAWIAASLAAAAVVIASIRPFL